ncbi:hypothetical protein [Mucilaginibacter sp. SP1R1]|uniref:hypothetical protein n=1 Tax=Mucilaginibacter sp. SP1R1 TaxID=2723091 RepID=UPI0016074662|nr:hypothetical protein [Mucilaginibacter sp. SP1R1]MBB6152066.1 hypothetical protein [Mucilaginibacter sp. SP1R1]
MKSAIDGLHSFPNGYLIIIVVLAMASGAYGFMNLSSVVFGVPNYYRSDIEQSDKLVIGFFNVAISVIAICSVMFMIR